MGGSGGGGAYPPGGAGSGSTGPNGSTGGENCNFDFNTTIFGPVPGIAENLNVGDILDIKMTDQRSVGLFDPQQNRQQVGSIAGAAQIPALVACIEAGNLYEAKVTEASGSRITIRVTNV